jgi:hypothetical protein
MTAPRQEIAPLAAGAVFGALVQLAGRRYFPGWWIVHLGAPWLACAFLAGAWTARAPGRRRERGALAGAQVIVAGTIAYYAVNVAIRGTGSAVAYAAAMTVAWVAIGAPLGVLFGAAGAVARAGSARWQAAALALAGGALAGEGLLLLLTRPGSVGRPVFVLELAAGAACPLVAFRRAPALGAALTALVAAFAVLAAGGLRLFMHRHGWHGP